MHPRTRPPGRHSRSAPARHRPPAPGRRPGLYLGVAVAGAVVVNLVAGTGPPAQAEAGDTGSVSVARQLGLDDGGGGDVTRDLESLADLAASRSTREDAEAAARSAQAAADQAVLDRQRAEAEAAALRALAEAAAAQRAAEEKAAADRAATAEAAAARAAAQPPVAARPAPSAAARPPAPGPGNARARVSNSSGPVSARVQAAADAVVSHVAGAGSITLGGTRPSAADPGGHPSGNALDYMVLGNGALGDAIVAYHVAHWNDLGVDYLIWKQRMLSSPGGAWAHMENRGSATANHVDHVHVNYR